MTEWWSWFHYKLNRIVCWTGCSGQESRRTHPSAVLHHRCSTGEADKHEGDERLHAHHPRRGARAGGGHGLCNAHHQRFPTKQLSQRQGQFPDLEWVLEALTQPVCQQHGYFCKHSRIVFKNKIYFKKRGSDLLRWISHLDKSVISYLWSKFCTLGLWVIFRWDSSQRLAACGPRLAADGLSRKKLLHGVFSEMQVYINKVFTRQWEEDYEIVLQ